MTNCKVHFNEKQIVRLEDETAPLLKKNPISWEMDDDFLKHFKEIGLEPKEVYEPGDEFISRI